jgi:hypothetical protein
MLSGSKSRLYLNSFFSCCILRALLLISSVDRCTHYFQVGILFAQLVICPALPDVEILLAIVPVKSLVHGC